MGLSGQVSIALLVTTTFNVHGLMYIVFKVCFQINQNLTIMEVYNEYLA